jgi:hypothetical protein
MPAQCQHNTYSCITGAVYQWQVNAGSGFINIVNNGNYSGVNTGTLQINNAPSSWNGYQYRCVVDGNNSAVSTLGFTSYWNGSVSNAWKIRPTGVVIPYPMGIPMLLSIVELLW